jgi:hypothetical protein
MTEDSELHRGREDWEIEVTGRESGMDTFNINKDQRVDCFIISSPLTRTASCSLDVVVLNE